MTVLRIRYQTEFPESSSRFGDSDSEVENVWKRRVPVDPVVRNDCVVSSQDSAERSHEYGVCVDVNAAVLQHDIGSPHVTYMLITFHRLSEDLPHALALF